MVLQCSIFDFERFTYYWIFRTNSIHNLSFDRCCSSLITRLHIRMFSFHDCLCLMDGRFSELTTLTLDVDYIRYWTLDNNNQVKHLGGTIDNRYFDCYF